MLTKRIAVVPANGTWVVRAGGAVIGESERALELVLTETSSLIFFPREDVGMAFLEPSTHVAQTEGIGQASYFGIVTRSTTIKNAAWSYPEPSEGAMKLAGHIAFDSERVTVEQV
ncbi:MAG: DUF427 domain-containing protein [Pseudomonadota bacterium]